MKKQSIKGIAFIAVAGILATGCDLLKDLEYTVTPSPLEMHGDSVKVKIDVQFPEKGINKKAYAELTPMIGTHALKTVTVAGEKAAANGQYVIQYKEGGKMVYEDVIPYSADMEVSDLQITGKVFKGDKEKETLTPEKIAEATVVTPLRVNKDFKVIYSADEFQRVTKENKMATINYLKGNASVRSSELKDQDIKDLQAWMVEAQSNAKITPTGINVTGFASIEGEEDKNNTLSTERANNAKTAVMGVAKKAKNETGQNEAVYSTSGRGEDFEGFKKSLEASSMDQSEKDLILRILNMSASPAQREKDIKDLGKTFTFLDKNVFPAQRRAEVNVAYDKTGYSDEELVALSKSNPDTLNVEELLFTATLTEDLNEKLRLYKEVERQYPTDYRGANNVGSVLYMQNKMDEAKAQFEKANTVEDNVISKNNLAAIAGASGDRATAKSLLAQASGAGSEVSYNNGILAIQDGRYDDAISNFGSDASYNKALAQLLNKDASSALSTIEASADAETARGYYVKAIIGARQDKLDMIVNNLKSAFAKDAAYKATAAKDREFMKYMDNASFSAIVK